LIYPPVAPSRSASAVFGTLRPVFVPRVWAAHSHGYRVQCGKKRIGFVADVIEPRGGVDGALVVRGGLFGRRLSLVPLDDVVSCDRERWRVTIEESAHQADPKLLAGWRRRARKR
jgi:hypothetical protein